MSVSVSNGRRPKTKSPAENSAGLRKAPDFNERSVAQLDRPAEAGMVVPVMMRETEHLH
jgi:hypothetical protein